MHQSNWGWEDCAPANDKGGKRREGCSPHPLLQRTSLQGVGQEWLMRMCPQLCVVDKSHFPGPCLGNYGVSDQLALHSETQLKHCESSQ